MAKPEKKQLAWTDVDETTLKGTVLSSLTAVREARKVVKEKTAAFEAAFLAEARKKDKVPKGKTLRFSYNFGRIGVAIDDETETAKKGEAFKL